MGAELETLQPLVWGVSSEWKRLVWEQQARGLKGGEWLRAASTGLPQGMNLR